ncbi:MAG: hypothetical protein H7246_11300 [Phycisphaerae bacterium]|nr:hypothetical protein [Saprospiraceae bacterium]
MKKLVFANCILAIAVIFSFCAKPSLNEELKSMGTDLSVSDRGGPCTVTNVPPVNTADLTFCGTNTNATSCAGCPPGTPQTGVEFFAAGTPVSFPVTGPITFSVRGSIQTSVNLATPAGQTGWVFIPAGGCQKFHVDANCNISAVK